MGSVAKVAAAVSDPAEEIEEEKAVYFEDAIALTGHGKYHAVLLLGAGFCLISLIFSSLNTSYLLPSAQCDFHMSSGEKGLLNSALFIGMMVSSFLWGFLADTRGRRNILLLTLCCDATITIISSFAHTFPFFIFCRFLNGFFVCGPSAVVYAYLGEFHPERTRTRVIIWAGTLLCVGTIALPALAWLVIPQDWVFEMPWNTTFTSWRIFVLFCSVPSIFTACLLGFVLIESPKFLLARGNPEKALKALKYVYAMNTGKDPETYPVKKLQVDPNEIVPSEREVDSKDKLAFLKTMYDQTAPLFQRPHLRATLLACAIQFGLYTSCNGFVLWVPDIFNRQAEYESIYPNSSATVCQMITTLSALEGPTNGNGLDSRAIYHFSTNGNELIFNVSNQKPDSIFSSHLDVLPANDAGGTATELCVSNVDQTAFTTALIIGICSGVAYLVVGMLVNKIPKTLIITLSLLVSASSGVGLFFAWGQVPVTALSTAFVVFSGLCIAVLNSAVIDVYPTHLRAMAVCISLMFGRLGTVFGSLLLGALLDLNCASAFFVLSGIVLACSVLAVFFPTPGKSKTVYNVNC